jgi:hypothetical protein
VRHDADVPILVERSFSGHFEERLYEIGMGLSSEAAPHLLEMAATDVALPQFPRTQTRCGGPDFSSKKTVSGTAS